MALAHLLGRLGAAEVAGHLRGVAALEQRKILRAPASEGHLRRRPSAPMEAHCRSGHRHPQREPRKPTRRTSGAARSRRCREGTIAPTHAARPRCAHRPTDFASTCGSPTVEVTPPSPPKGDAHGRRRRPFQEARHEQAHARRRRADRSAHRGRGIRGPHRRRRGHRPAARHVGRHPPRGARDDQGPGVLARRRPAAWTSTASACSPSCTCSSSTAASHRAFPKEYGGAGRTTARTSPASRSSSLADPSLQIKSGVQWGLFGSAVLQLGTKEHHDKWLPGIMSLEIPGAFAMTETGHGSDVAAIGTTATYDPETEEFVIHTPFRGAWKDYLGNAALHGIAATVFAQLITNGVNHGVHCFYVPLRDENGEFLPGIGGEDDGLKGGLNGIDNGRLHFDHVRVPRTNLLNKYGDVAADGTYSSHISSPGRRFFTMLGTLVQGRVSLDGAAIVGIGARPGHRDHVREPAPPVRLRRRHRRGRAARLRQAPAPPAHPARARRTRRSSRTTSSCRSSTPSSAARPTPDADREDLETLAAALKPLSTWHALDTLQEAREACGGAGLPRREPPRRPARRPRHLRHLRGRQQRAAAARRQAPAQRLRASSSRARMPRRSPRYAVAPDRGQGVPRRRAAPARPGGRATSARPRARSSAGCAPTSSTSCSPAACSRWSPTSRRACARHPALARRRGGAVQREPVRADRGRARARRAAAVGGVHGCRQRDRATRAPSTCSRGCATCSASASSRSTSPGT